MTSDHATAHAAAHTPDPSPAADDTPRTATNVVWHTGVERRQRPHRGATVWFTGLSGSGKSTVSVLVERELTARGVPAYRLDGDNVRHGLNRDLGFAESDRTENIRRVGEVARLFADAGVIALVPVISPYRADRDRVRALHSGDDLPFLEVFVDTPLAECERRDPKGLYAQARAGRIRDFTGIDAPYEAPHTPELRLTPDDGDPTGGARQVISALEDLLGPLAGHTP